MQHKFLVVRQDGSVVGTNDMEVVAAWGEHDDFVAAISTAGSGSYIDIEGNFQSIATTEGPEDNEDYSDDEEDTDDEDEEEFDDEEDDYEP
jgi:hypothetical protein